MPFPAASTAEYALETAPTGSEPGVIESEEVSRIRAPTEPVPFPTAKQVVVDEQASERSPPVADGTASVFHVLPESVEVKISGAFELVLPVAKQVVTDGQARSDR